MSQTHTSHQHGLHTMNASRPKSKARKRLNKSKARPRKEALLNELEKAKAAKNDNNKAEKTTTKNKSAAKKSTSDKTKQAKKTSPKEE
ncbi:hypothetical protein GF376_02580 [Candidatus Peregrinibacteria bacterium]|nr:hypothetical protein [Candidatus Peregrinibacteria bacterium]